MICYCNSADAIYLPYRKSPQRLQRLNRKRGLSCPAVSPLLSFALDPILVAAQRIGVHETIRPCTQGRAGRIARFRVKVTNARDDSEMDYAPRGVFTGLPCCRRSASVQTVLAHIFRPSISGTVQTRRIKHVPSPGLARR